MSGGGTKIFTGPHGDSHTHAGHSLFLGRSLYFECYYTEWKDMLAGMGKFLRKETELIWLQ